MRPMLAAKADIDNIEFPVYISPKLDGIRALLRWGIFYSRKYKELPNKELQMMAQTLSECHQFNYLDGELMFGNPTANDVFRKTSSCVMSHDKCTKELRYYVFDWFGVETLPYELRMTKIKSCNSFDFVKIVPQIKCEDIEHLNECYDKYLDKGYEGIMIRSPVGLYKRGRSTIKQAYLLKLKPESDAEAKIVGYTERMHNANKKTIDERGYTKRSSHQCNQIPMDMLGAFIVENDEHQIFSVGSGFTEQQRKDYWQNIDDLMGKTITYKYQSQGSHESPRFPIFKAFRED